MNIKKFVKTEIVFLCNILSIIIIFSFSIRLLDLFVLNNNSSIMLILLLFFIYIKLYFIFTFFTDLLIDDVKKYKLIYLFWMFIYMFIFAYLLNGYIDNEKMSGKYVYFTKNDFRKIYSGIIIYSMIYLSFSIPIIYLTRLSFFENKLRKKIFFTFAIIWVLFRKDFKR